MTPAEAPETTGGQPEIIKGLLEPAQSFIVMDNFHCTVDCTNICILAHV